MANQEDIFEYLRGEIHNKNNLINELQDKNLTLMEDQERLTQEHERSQQAQLPRQICRHWCCRVGAPGTPRMTWLTACSRATRMRIGAGRQVDGGESHSPTGDRICAG